MHILSVIMKCQYLSVCLSICLSIYHPSVLSVCLSFIIQLAIQLSSLSSLTVDLYIQLSSSTLGVNNQSNLLIYPFRKTYGPNLARKCFPQYFSEFSSRRKEPQSWYHSNSGITFISTIKKTLCFFKKILQVIMGYSQTRQTK